MRGLLLKVSLTMVCIFQTRMNRIFGLKKMNIYSGMTVGYGVGRSILLILLIRSNFYAVRVSIPIKSILDRINLIVFK